MKHDCRHLSETLCSSKDIQTKEDQRLATEKNKLRGRGLLTNFMLTSSFVEPIVCMTYGYDDLLWETN